MSKLTLFGGFYLAIIAILPMLLRFTNLNIAFGGTAIWLEPGMTLAIEPMVIQGKPNILELDDGWTIITEDGSLAAHYENTILITENEPKILTI